MFSIVPPSNYRRRPRVSFCTHWQRKARAARINRAIDLAIFWAMLAAMATFTLHAAGVL